MRKEKLERNKRIYLDYAASTPVDDKVLKVMQKAENFAWSNPSSLHQEGERAKRILDEARTAVACYLHCKTGEVFFTSGGTEGANIAIFGVIVKAKEWIDLPHVISSSIEHPAILKPLKKLESNGEIQLTFVNPDKRGLINPETIEKMMKQNTILVCLMHANNEIGTIQPIAKVAAVIKKVRKEKPLDHKEPLLNYPYLLVDAGQSVLYENVSIERLGADIMILDGIKMYGPRGVGILVVRHGAALRPVAFGGGQERGLRPGTENAIAALGLAEALKIAAEKRERESFRLAKLRDYAIAKILGEIPHSSLNGDPIRRLPNNINICFKSQGSPLKNFASKGDPLDYSEFLVIKLDTLGFAVSAASACSNLDQENPSYVIESLGKKECASSSLRFTLGRATQKSDLDKLIVALKKIIKK